MAIQTGASVTGIDAAPGLLRVAKTRNPNNNFLEEDIEDLPFKDNSFDVVTGFNSFQYAGSFENAISEAVRVLKTSGRLVMAIWDKPEMSDSTQVLKAIGALLPPPPPGTPGPFALSEDGKVESIFSQLGLKTVFKTTVACPATYPHLADGIKSFMGTGPAALAIENHDKSTVEATIAKALQSFKLVDDIHYLHNQFLVFIAEKV